MIQCPAAFCLTLSCMSAFFDPNSFMASLLSVGWKMFCSWFLTQPGLASEETLMPREEHWDAVGGAISSLGVPYRLTSSFSELYRRRGRERKKDYKRGLPQKYTISIKDRVFCSKHDRLNLNLQQVSNFKRIYLSYVYVR